MWQHPAVRQGEVCCYYLWFHLAACRLLVRRASTGPDWQAEASCSWHVCSPFVHASIRLLVGLFVCQCHKQLIFCEKKVFTCLMLTNVGTSPLLSDGAWWLIDWWATAIDKKCVTHVGNARVVDVVRLSGAPWGPSNQSVTEFIGWLPSR